MPRQSKPPLLMRGGDGRVYVVLGYSVDGNTVTATKRVDVTEQFDALVAHGRVLVEGSVKPRAPRATKQQSKKGKGQPNGQAPTTADAEFVGATGQEGTE